MTSCDYANARVRGMEGRLLGARGLAELLAQPGLAARLDYLKKTDYGGALAAPLAREGELLRRAEQGLRARLVDDLLRIDRFLRGERTRALFRAFLAFEDGWNLKTILRGASLGEPPARTYGLLAPTPVLDDAALAELVRQKEVKAVVDLLATWKSDYAAPLTAAFEGYRAHRELFPLELALDRFLFARALAAARTDGEDGRVLRGFLETQIDLANAATLLKCPEGGRSDELFIPGGRLLTVERFQRLSSLRDPELREALARCERLHLAAGLAAMERSDPFAVDQAFAQSLRRAAAREARVHPLSLAVPLAFVLERRAEVRRIRLVLRGASFGLPAEELVSLVET